MKEKIYIPIRISEEILTDEIAKKLDVSNSKIKVSLHRIRKKIKISLNKGGYNYGE